MWWVRTPQAVVSMVAKDIMWPSVVAEGNEWWLILPKGLYIMGCSRKYFIGVICMFGGEIFAGGPSM